MVRLRSARQGEEEFELWLEQVTERADPFMAWLGVVFAFLVGFELAVDVSPDTGRALTWAGWAIWAVFLLEFLAKLWLAPPPRAPLGLAARHSPAPTRSSSGSKAVC